jgi:hypothetical protein
MVSSNLLHIPTSLPYLQIILKTTFQKTYEYRHYIVQTISGDSKWDPLRRLLVLEELKRQRDIWDEYTGCFNTGICISSQKSLHSKCYIERCIAVRPNPDL